MVRKIIVGMENCPKCKMLKSQHEDAEYVEVKGEDMLTLLSFARMVDIKSMPFVCVVGEQYELDKELSVNVVK